MRKIGLYLKLALIFVASMLMPTSFMTEKVEKILAELKGEPAQ